MTGETFQNMRIELGKTQDEMADMLSVNVRTVQRIESTETVPHRYALAIGRVTTNEQQPETETP